MTRNRTETLVPNNDVETIADLAADAYERSESLTPVAGEIRSFIISRDEQRVTDSFERYLDQPSRPRGGTTVRDVDSFATLILRGADVDDTILFADERANTVTAILNYYGWGDHRITLHLTTSPEWEHWKKLNNQLVTQVAFAEHIEDGLTAIVSPPAADLMELAQTFQAHREVQFESGQRLSSGDVKFRYHEETKAGAGQKGELEVPEKFDLRLPVYRGGAPFPITARLRYRISQNGLGLGYKLDRPDELLDAAFSEVTDQLKNELAGYAIVAGSAPNPVAEI
ncbi:hypothetical protein CH304_00375 [Rhodococcus sp. 15-649-1-2]|nr:DUF2303 family protein [Rhodococcus sp. 15-649-1-2]OZE88060.1 hypothetical protein CH304_00375 [Rhodococcus sp. 15-649-1-2]